MHRSYKIVVDTNLLAPSLYSLTPLALRLASGEFTLCLSPDIDQEVREKITYLAPILGFSAERQDRLKLAESLALYDALREISFARGAFLDEHCPAEFGHECRDEKDRPFLWAAEKCGSHFLLTGDGRHLLPLRVFGGATICTLNEFWVYVAA